MRRLVVVVLVGCKSAASAPDSSVAIEPNRACVKDADCVVTAACGCPQDVCAIAPEAINVAHVANHRMACMAMPCASFDAASITDADRAKCSPLPSAWAASCVAGRCMASAR